MIKRIIKFFDDLEFYAMIIHNRYENGWYVRSEG